MVYPSDISIEDNGHIKIGKRLSGIPYRENYTLLWAFVEDYLVLVIAIIFFLKDCEVIY